MSAEKTIDRMLAGSLCEQEYVRAAMLRRAIRYRVTVDLDGDRLTYYCEKAGEAGGLREAFEKKHGAKCNVIICDQEQDRRIY